MFSALFSFLGGSLFRTIWGEISHWLTARQDHLHEIERLKLQGDLDAAQHERNQAAIKLQADLGIKTIQVQAEAALSQIEGTAWGELVSSTTRLTGIRFIDIWNQSVRPLLATLAIVLVVAQVIQNGFVLSDWDRELVAAILGIYVADRSLQHRGK